MPASFPGRLVTALVVVAAAPLAVASDATAIDWSAATPVSAGTAAAVQAVAVAPDGAATVFYAVETGVHTRLMASHRPASGAGGWL